MDGTQINNYKNKSHIIKDETIYKLYDGLVAMKTLSAEINEVIARITPSTLSIAVVSSILHYDLRQLIF